MWAPAEYSRGLGREAIVEAFRARRCFAATDNIGLVVKRADHLMGEEFPLAGQCLGMWAKEYGRFVQ